MRGKLASAEAESTGQTSLSEAGEIQKNAKKNEARLCARKRDRRFRGKHPFVSLEGEAGTEKGGLPNSKHYRSPS